MRTVSIKIGAQQRNWVAGLQWTTQDRVLQAGEVRQEALHLQANLYAQRKPLRMGIAAEGTRYDVGYGALPAAGRRGSYYSLGALLAQVRKGHWSATFDLSDGLFLYVAVLDGNTIDPTEYGEVVGSRADVDKARESHADMDLGHTEYGFNDLQGFVDEFSGELIRVVFLDGKQVQTSLKIGAVVSVAVTAVVCGGWYVKERGAEAAARVARMRAAAEALLRQQKGQAAAVQADPLASLPRPDELQRACAQAVNGLPVALNGWQVGSIECGQAGATVVWKATGHAWNLGRPQGVLAYDGQSVIARLPFSLSVSGGGEGHASMDMQLGLLRDLVGRSGASLEIHPVVQQALPGEAAPNAPPVLQQQVFTVKMPWVPWSVPFGQVSGLRIDSIRYAESTWIVGGSVYGS